MGIVVGLGSGVTNGAEGDRVAIPWLGWACGACEYCASGWETLCEQQRNTGYSVNGGFAEYRLFRPPRVDPRAQVRSAPGPRGPQAGGWLAGWGQSEVAGAQPIASARDQRPYRPLRHPRTMRREAAARA